MPPKNKAKAAGISASSFFDLKAELAKQEDEFAKNKATGEKNTMIVGGVKRPDKKPTIWARPNKGVNARAARDIELEAISKPTLESARAALERKAKIYDKLRKGKTGGLNDAQYDALLVDFDSMGPPDAFEPDSEDEDESLTVPKPSKDDLDDPIVEYEDEFGRMRTARRSEVPRALVPDSQPEYDEDEDIVIRNPVNHFPIYEPSAERVAAIAEAHSEANNPLGVHYDASAEVRAKGAGFYQFSGDEEERLRQMEELKMAREETERTRKDAGAVDLKPGEVEGMQEDEEGEGVGSEARAGKSRAMEKRKRELEDRRRMVDAKRRRVKPVGADEGGQSAASVPTFKASHEDLKAPTPIFEAVPPSIAASLDPFAALETQANSVNKKGKGKGKERVANDPQHAADDFLARLEREMLGGHSTGKDK